MDEQSCIVDNSNKVAAHSNREGGRFLAILIMQPVRVHLFLAYLFLPCYIFNEKIFILYFVEIFWNKTIYIVCTTQSSFNKSPQRKLMRTCVNIPLGTYLI